MADNEGFSRLAVYPLILDGQYEAAIAGLNKAIAREPNNPLLFHCRANCHHAMKNYALAIKDYSRCLTLKQDRYYFWGRGLVYADAGDYTKALADYEEVIKMAGNDKPALARYYRLKINALEHLNKLSEAEIWCSKLLAIEPNNFEIVSKRAGLLRKLGQPQKAIADYNAILKNNPDDGSVLKDRGDTYCEMKEWKKAVADYTQAIKEEPELARFIEKARAAAVAKLAAKG
jgi:tetratricopeptide (TPR) repeat protein